MKEIKEYFLSTLKESMKLAILTLIVFFTVGLALSYIFIELLHIDKTISGFIAGFIFAIIVVIIDHKKFHFHQKMIENNRVLFKKIFKY